MKIVDVCPFYCPTGGGVRTYIDSKLAAAPALGHEMVVLAPGREHRVERRGKGARIIYLPGPRFPLDPRYRYFADDGSVEAALSRERADFVEASSPWRSAAMVARWQGSAPRALIMHADPLASYAYRWFEDVADRSKIDRAFTWFWRHLRRIDDAFDRVVAANSALARRLSGGGLAKVVTNPMGITPGLFAPMHRDAALRRDLLARCGLDEEAGLLLGVGRHAPEKRWPMIVDACVAAGRERPIGLVLVGDGRERGRLVRHIAGNPHIQLIAPIGDRSALARLMASADALIHGCESETFCMVAAEARASGLPVIAPDRGGAADQAHGGGALYRAGHAAHAALAIRRVLARGLPRTAASPSLQSRTMNDHFKDLFDDYAAIAAARAA